MGLSPEWLEGRPPEEVLINHKTVSYNGLMDVVMREEIEQELQLGVIKPFPREEARIILKTFLRAKKDGTYRKILDCTPLNQYLVDQKFKMEDARTVAQVLQPNMWATSLDIKKAFHHVNVSPDLRPFLCFEYHNQIYAYHSMPFGVKSAPRVFTKIMHHCLSVARQIWKIHIIQYIDDILILHQDRTCLEASTISIARFLEQLGWILNIEKSQVNPNRIFLYLGWEWNTQDFVVKLSEEKNLILIRLVSMWKKYVCQQKNVPVRHLASLIGRLSQTRLQHDTASLYLSFLNKIKTEGVRTRGWSGKVKLNLTAKQDLLWWEEHLAKNTPHTLTPFLKEADVWTDASASGWGAHAIWEDNNVQQDLNIMGFWENNWTSNRRELEAVQKSLTNLSAHPKTSHIKNWLIHSDNSTTVYNINRKASTHSLIGPMRALFSSLHATGTSVRAIHIKGLLNNTADSLSRLSKSGDYSLDPQILQNALQSLNLEISCDLFASRNNHKHPIYYTLSLQDSKAQGRDAFSIEWGTLRNPLIHPPIPLLQKCINLIKFYKIQAVVIAPQWPFQWWTNSLMEITMRTVPLGEARRILTPGRCMLTRGYSLPPGEMTLHVVHGGKRNN
jgi:ribonuclease HI